MKRFLPALALLALLLAGCGGAGGIASPRYTDSHDRTTTTETTETQVAELEQSNNKQICAGLVVIGSCNVTQVNTQRTASQPVTAPVSPAQPADDMGLGLFCFGAAGIVGFFLLCMVLMSLFAPSYGN